MRIRFVPCRGLEVHGCGGLVLDIVQHFGRRWRQNGCGGWPPARSFLRLGILNRDNMAPSGWSARRSTSGFLLASSEPYPQGCEQTEAMRSSLRLPHRMVASRKNLILRINISVWFRAAIKGRIENRDASAGRYPANVGSGTMCGQTVVQPIAVATPAGKKRLARADGPDHIGARPAVVVVALGQFQPDPPTRGVEQCVDLRGQPAVRATHSIGSPPCSGRSLALMSLD